MNNTTLTTNATVKDPAGNALSSGVTVTLLTSGNYEFNGQVWESNMVTRTGNQLKHPAWRVEW